MKQVLLKLLWSVNCILTRQWKWRFVFISFKYLDLLPPLHSMHGLLESVLCYLNHFYSFLRLTPLLGYWSPSCSACYSVTVHRQSAVFFCHPYFFSYYWTFLISKAHSSLIHPEGTYCCFPFQKLSYLHDPFYSKTLWNSCRRCFLLFS